jgi:hypothetical protein
VYEPLILGLTEIVELVELFDHEYTPPRGDAVAVNVVDWPLQIVALFTERVGVVFT